MAKYVAKDLVSNVFQTSNLNQNKLFNEDSSITDPYTIYGTWYLFISFFVIIRAVYKISRLKGT